MPRVDMDQRDITRETPEDRSGSARCELHRENRRSPRIFATQLSLNLERVLRPPARTTCVVPKNTFNHSPRSVGEYTCTVPSSDIWHPNRLLCSCPPSPRSTRCTPAPAKSSNARAVSNEPTENSVKLGL